MPFTQTEIARARDVPFLAILDHLGAYRKRDDSYIPLNKSNRSARLHVSYEGREFRFVFTDDKFVNELVSRDAPGRGGGGAIDFVKHLTGVGFVPAVKICLDVAEALSGRR